jgi:hypothetical protein
MLSGLAPGRVVSDELIAERRAEARREAQAAGPCVSPAAGAVRGDRSPGSPAPEPCGWFHAHPFKPGGGAGRRGRG